MARCAVFCLLFLALAACGVRPSAGAPGPTVHVVQEGIHSGLLVPAEWIWPQATGVAEFSFGDRAWMMGEDRSTLRACRLAVWPSDGAVYLKRGDGDVAQVIRHERWRALAVPLSPIGAEQMRRELAAWLPPGPDLASWPDGAVFRASRPFHLYRTCHDQVAAALLAAGVPLAGSWLPARSADRFQAEVAEALADLQTRGIRWVESAPE